MSSERLGGNYSAGEYQLSSEILGDENILVLNSSKSSRLSKLLNNRFAMPVAAALVAVSMIAGKGEVYSAPFDDSPSNLPAAEDFVFANSDDLFSDLGDVNCSGRVNAIDAELVLQKDAGLIRTLACEEAGDVNNDYLLNAVDAALILQFDAGLIDEFPAQKEPTATSTPTRTVTRTRTPTSIPTRTPTRTPTPTASATETRTNTPTKRSTNTPTEASTRTPTNTPTETAISTPTRTPTATATITPTRTRTPTFTPTRTFPTETPTPTPSEALAEIRLEAERYQYGPHDCPGDFRPRSNASNLGTMWLQGGLNEGYCNMDFHLQYPATYSLELRYSSDGGCCYANVYAVGGLLARVDIVDTRKPGMLPGEGWNNFEKSGKLGAVSFSAGDHVIRIEADPGSFEVDVMILRRIY